MATEWDTEYGTEERLWCNRNVRTKGGAYRQYTTNLGDVTCKICLEKAVTRKQIEKLKKRL